MFDASSKKLLLAVLVACYAVQSGLVYADDVDLPLSAEAVEGRKIWHEKACQVCHQLWGQGGFLGPDLTNAASRVDEARLAVLLTEGSGQMPALHLSPEEISAVRAYLRELDRPDLGRGQLRLGKADDGASPQEAFEAAVLGADPPPEVREGFQRFRSGICATCHVPFQLSAVGAPDLSTAVERNTDQELDAVLTHGRPERGMPPPVPALTEEERSAMIAYLHWLRDARDELRRAYAAARGARSVRWSDLPWWEYR